MERSKLFIICIFVMIIAAPLAFKLIPPNGTIGFKVPDPTGNPELWLNINSFAGWSMIFSSALGGIYIRMNPDAAERRGVLVLTCLWMCAIAATMIYVSIVS